MENVISESAQYGSCSSSEWDGKKFEDLHELPAFAREALLDNRLEKPMDFQFKVIPLAMKGYNITGIAKTGSGKTLAYILPALKHIVAYPRRTSCLVMAPTRELAQQIFDQCTLVNGKNTAWNPEKHTYAKNFESCVVYGGVSRSKEWQRWQCPRSHIIVATPGRLLDLLSEDKSCVDLSSVSYFVLDEADVMIDDGFEDDIMTICQHFRVKPQTLYFSATWPTRIEEVAARIMSTVAKTGDHKTVALDQVQTGPVVNPNIQQEVKVFDSSPAYWDYYRHEEQKMAHLQKTLSQLLQRKDDGYPSDAKIVVFVCTKKVCNTIANDLWETGVYADSIHGDKRQEQRLQVLDNFRSGKVRVLVATDVIGRGLDFPDCTHVILFHFPGDIDQYVHRVGRTARGADGRGNALIYFDYSSQQPNVPEELARALKDGQQIVPEELQHIVQEVKMLGASRGKWEEKSKDNGWSSRSWKREDPKNDGAVRNDWNDKSWDANQNFDTGKRNETPTTQYDEYNRNHHATKRNERHDSSSSNACKLLPSGG
eukprot:GEMP01002866.1.p1 GENE.GEMP01002866.1~~GEMP01002866.1.p1  ORF type:complete len:540 (+),score=129.35 GEMP01002866.1:155-1774(+)